MKNTLLLVGVAALVVILGFLFLSTSNPLANSATIYTCYSVQNQASLHDSLFSFGEYECAYSLSGGLSKNFVSVDEVNNAGAPVSMKSKIVIAPSCYYTGSVGLNNPYIVSSENKRANEGFYLSENNELYHCVGSAGI